MAGVQGIANDLEVHLPSDARRTDTDLVTSALKALEWDVQVPHQRVKVRASEGWLTLEGELDWQYQRAAAERCVRNLIGVRGVSNLIILSAKVTPMDLKKRIEESFKRHAELEARGIRVQAAGGRVTLDGAVHSVAERDEAERAVWAAPGVTTVEDHLVVSV
jgi:osmotically-inducible protein OsmY